MTPLTAILSSAAADPFAAVGFLARGDDVGDWVKIVFGIIAVIVWAVSALAKAGAKKEPPPTESWTPEPWTPAVPPTAAPPSAWPAEPTPRTVQPAPPPIPAWANQQPVNQPASPGRKKGRKAGKAKPPVFAEAPVVLPPAVPAVRRQTTDGPSPAAAVRRMLTPAAIRRNFVATTLFDPPPSARDER